MAAQLLEQNVLGRAAELKDYSLGRIHGMEELKETVRRVVLLPRQFPELFQNIQSYSKFLLHSLPGCGKTFLVRCMAGECGYSLVSVQPSVVFSKYQG